MMFTPAELHHDHQPGLRRDEPEHRGPGRQLTDSTGPHVALLHRQRRQLVRGQRPFGRHRRRHGRGGGRRQPLRVEPGGHRACSTRSGFGNVVVARRPASRPGAVVESDRVEPEEVLRLQRPASSTSARTAARPSPRPRRPVCRPATACASRRCPARRATSGWRAARATARTACGTPPTPARRFTKLSNVEQADTIGFGKAATGATYQALYTSAKIGGVRGIFRSTTRARAGCASTTTPTSTATPARRSPVTRGSTAGCTWRPTGAASSTATRRTPAAVAGAAVRTRRPRPTGACAVTYKITNQWSGGFQADV